MLIHLFVLAHAVLVGRFHIEIALADLHITIGIQTSVGNAPLFAVMVLHILLWNFWNFREIKNLPRTLHVDLVSSTDVRFGQVRIFFGGLLRSTTQNKTFHLGDSIPL